MKIAITIIIIISSILHIKAEENDKKSEKNDINKIVVHENRYEKLVEHATLSLYTGRTRLRHTIRRARG